MSINPVKIKTEVRLWLGQHGWPSMPQADQFVLNNLDKLFLHLLHLGLVRQDMYEAFVVSAHLAWQKKMGL